MTEQLRKRAPKPKNESDANDKVGYGRPPKQFWFRKGQSGNLKGRPKGSKNTDTTIKEVFLKPVPITENGRKRTVSTFEAVLLQLRKKSIEGNLPAIDRVLKLSSKIQAAIAEEKVDEAEARKRADQERVNELLAMVKYIIDDQAENEDEEQ